MYRSTIVLCLGIAAGCSPDEEIETVYDPCSPLTISVAPDLGTAELQGIQGAIRAWEGVLPVRLVVGTGDRAVDVLPVRFEAGDTFYRGIYWDAVGEIWIARDALAPEDYALAIAHEMGHAFGLPHIATTERASVMNVGNLEVVPNEEDAAAVRARWASCGDPTPAE